MRLIETELPEVLVLEPQVFEDARGFAFESYNKRRFGELTGIDVEFVQDNRSRSAKNVIRGMHYQLGRPQGKLVSVIAGEIYDVAVDLRRSSPRFGAWVGVPLSAASRRMLWVPPGFGHGFLALAEGTEVHYKMSELWAPERERVIAWNDAKLAIRWPLAGQPIVSARDAKGTPFASAETFP